MTLSNPQTKSLRSWEVPKAWTTEMNGLLKDFLNQNIPCYCTFKGENTVYYLTESNSLSAYSDESDNYYSYSIDLAKCSIVSSSSKTYNKIETQYVNSTNQSQYPDGEKLDNWLYTYLGIPFENTIDPLKCQYGTYTGTGNYGSANSNSLTFSFQPSFLIINDGSCCIFCRTNGTLIGFGYSGIIKENTSWNKNTVTWYYSSSVR